MKKTTVYQDIIKSNRDIREMLFNRITELGLTLAAVERDAKEMGRKIYASRISAYFMNTDKVPAKDGLKQEDIIWLCDRYGIKVKVNTEIFSYDEKVRKQYINRKYGKSEIHNG